VSAASEPTTERRRGRQPALPSEQERRVILDATLRVLERRGFDRANLDEVLSEASLSTRAFYRHYSSKDELLVALYRQESMKLGARLARVVEEAHTPVDALGAWVDEVLAIGYEPKRVARAGLFRSKGTRDAAGIAEAQHAAAQALSQALVAVLRAGHEKGVFPATDPEADARTIHAITLQLVDAATEARTPRTRAEAVGHVLRFVLPALGAPSPSGNGGTSNEAAGSSR
jgi:AcrR family transcriptional regulator